MEALTNISVVQELAKRHGFHFSKGLGQNFLINPTVCPRIAELGNAEPGFGVLEIGTGFGVLTAELAKRADKVVAVEIDERLLPVLEETLAEFDNIEIVLGDVMKLDLAALLKEHFHGMPVAVCANLPYYITSPVLMRLLESRLPLTSITVMVQKEAAQRLCAEVGTREAGAITVGVRYYGAATQLFSVSRGSFLPAPNVDSAVIRIDLHAPEENPSFDEAFFFRLVKSGFSQRRKTLANALGSMMGLDKERVYAGLDEIGVSRSVRMEALTFPQIRALSEMLQNA